MPKPFDLVPALLPGLVVTIELTAGAAVVATGAAFAAGLARLSPNRPVRLAARFYIEAFRGTSALVQLFWVYFALPLVGVSLDAMTAGIVVLGLNVGSYGAEVVRSAIQNVPAGQREAAVALNLSPRRTFWSIILPQAGVAMLPPAGNLFIELLKNTSLVSMITLSELTFRGQILRSETLRTVPIFTVVLFLYFALAMMSTAARHGLERWLGRSRRLEAAR
jgi:polar amino acid transport system permease protein